MVTFIKIIIFLIIALSSTAYTQNLQDYHEDSNFQNSFSSDLLMYRNSLPETNSTISSPSYYQNGQSLMHVADIQGAVLDNVIDSTNYIIGPGDVFLISLWGMERKQVVVNVNAEGSILIPMIGVINVQSLTLADAKSLIRDKINLVYKNIQVSIILSHLRKFKTYIYGEVKRKGSYVVNGNTRISDLLTLAGGITDNGKKRGIIIYNEFTKTTKYTDLLLVENGFNFNVNPYILEGDRIFVPPRKEVVHINGNIIYPGTYDYQIGDNVSDIIAIAGGFSRGADTNKILIYKYKNDIDSLRYTTISKSGIDTAKISPDDRIIICALPEYRIRRLVTIQGEVNNPGEYPIMKGRTTLQEVITTAGGLKFSADLKNIKLIRNRYSFPGDKEYTKLKKIPPSLQFPDEKNYFLTKESEEETTVNLSYEGVLKQQTSFDDVILENGDQIIVPEKTNSVKIIGGVVHPGLVKFEEDRNLRSYISECGGYLPNAKISAIKIIKNHSEKQLSPNHTDIEPGDVIYVPEKRYKNKVEIAKDWILIVGSLATTLLTVFALQDRLQ